MGEQRAARRLRHTVSLLRYAVIGLPLAVLAADAGAAEVEVKDCDDAGIGIASIVSAPVSFYDGKATAYLLDTIEPAAIAAGIAIVVPTPLEEDQLGGSTCWAVLGFSSIDLAKAKRSYDKTKGLLLELPTRVPKDGDIVAGEPLKLRINIGKGRVTVE